MHLPEVANTCACRVGRRAHLIAGRLHLGDIALSVSLQTALRMTALSNRVRCRASATRLAGIYNMSSLRLGTSALCQLTHSLHRQLRVSAGAVELHALIVPGVLITSRHESARPPQSKPDAHGVFVVASTSVR